MATKNWTATADFGSAIASTYIDDAIGTWHQGNADGQGFNSTRMPDADGETINGWTMDRDAGTDNSATFSSGNLILEFDRDAVTAVDFRYQRDVNTTLSATATFSMSFKLKITSYTTSNCGYIGFFDSEEDNNVNAMRLGLSPAQVLVQVFNDAGSAFNGSSGDVLSTDTQYWVRFRSDGSDVTGDVYSTEELFNAASTGDVSTTTLDLSTVTGTVNPDKFGTRNLAAAGTTRNMVWEIAEIDGDVCDWYSDAQASTTDFDFSGGNSVDYSSLVINTTGAGTYLYDLRKKVTSGGSFATFNNGGSHYTEAEIQALEDEFLYGFGLIAYLDTDGETALSVDDISVDYVADTIVPSIDFLRVRQESGTDFYALGYTMTDNISVAFGETRFSDDGGSSWYITDWDDTNHKKLKTAFASYDVDNSVKILNGNTTEAPTPYCYYGNVFDIDLSELGYSASDELIFQVRATDISSNVSSWVTATQFSAGGGAGGILTPVNVWSPYPVRG